MKVCYVDTEHRAIADLVDTGNGWEITRINVPRASRGQGVGTRLLQQILADADVSSQTLWLAPVPSDGMNYRQLRDWYERHGFQPSTVRKGMMVR